MKFYRMNNASLHANTSVSINDNVLRLQWENLNNAEPVSGDVSLDFDELKQRNGFADYTLWVLIEGQQKWVPIFSETLVTKQNAADFARIHGNLMAYLFVRLASDSLDDCSLAVAVSQDSDLSLPGTAIEVQNTIPVYKQCFPKLEIGTPTIESGIANFPISLKAADGSPLPAEATVYCEATIGSLLTNRVNLIDGVGSAKVSVTGLEGHSGKLKAGFKFYTGLSEKNFTA